MASRTVNRNDVITAHGLDALMDNQLMPTLEVIGERFPSLSSAERQQTLVSACKQYLSEYTKPLDVACSDALGRVSG